MVPSMRFALRSGGAVLASALLLLGIAAVAPAWSDTYTHRDATHDVASTAVGGGAYHHAKDGRRFDATRIQVVHGRERIRFNVRLRSASLKGLDWRTVMFSLKTSGDNYTGSWQRTPGMVQYILVDDSTGRSFQCNDELSGTDNRTVWMSLSRACLGSPKWIRAAVFVSGHVAGRALQDNTQVGTWDATNDIRFTRRLHSG
jgi:hypothetical protein